MAIVCAAASSRDEEEEEEEEEEEVVEEEEEEEGVVAHCLLSHGMPVPLPKRSIRRAESIASLLRAQVLRAPATFLVEREFCHENARAEITEQNWRGQLAPF